ncbi:MAG: ester cyclase [Flavisolibacter sp.]|nr:ester cyclase [Flavisolibacter sp.]
MEKLLNKETIIAGGNSGIASETSKNKSLHDFYRNYIAAANARDFAAIANVVAENVTLNGVPVKREDIIAEFKGLVNAVPDFTWHIEDLVVEEDRIAARLRDTGTPEATTFFGQNPNGKSVTFSEFGSYKIRDGLFVEMSYLIDVPSISQQLKK